MTLLTSLSSKILTVSFSHLFCKNKFKKKCLGLIAFLKIGKEMTTFEYGKYSVSRVIENNFGVLNTYIHMPIILYKYLKGKCHIHMFILFIYLNTGAWNDIL